MPDHLQVMVMTEVAQTGSSAVVAATSRVSPGITTCGLAAIATIIIISIAATAAVDVPFQGGKRGIDRTLITTLERLNQAHQVAYDVAGQC
jgi:hypothetical protein